MSSLRMLLFGIGGGALVVWLLGFTGIMIATRPRSVRPDPPTDVLGSSRPAVANLLANRWRCTPDAVRATLADLITRGYLAVRRDGPDPTQTSIEIRDESPPGLTRYERRLLGRLRTQASGGRVSLPALSFPSHWAASRWLSRFATEVAADAKARDLARPGINPDFLMATALVPALALAAWTYQEVRTDRIFSAIAVLVAVLLTLAHIGVRVRNRYRPTPAGRTAAAHWLGVRTHLREHRGELADTTLDDPALTDELGAYAVALGLTPTIAEQVQFAPVRTRKISGPGGTLRVSFPRELRFCWGWGALGSVAASAAALFAAVVGSVVLSEYGGYLPGIVVTGGWFAVAALGLVCLGFIVLAAADVLGSREVTGTVVLLERYTPGNDTTSASRYVLAVAAGTPGAVDACILPEHLGEGLTVGCAVALQVRRWTGLVTRLAVLGGPVAGTA